MVEKESLIYYLSFGPKSRSKTWPAYFINGYNFHTQSYGIGKATMNYGICVQSGTTLEDEFYGLLDEIVDLEYLGPLMHVVLFKGTWFDPVKGMRVHSKFNLVEVNHKKKYARYEPFILAQQAHQVYYASYPSLKRDKADWWVACKIKARKKIDLRWKDTAYQQEEVNHTLDGVEEYDISSLRDPHGAMIPSDPGEIREVFLDHNNEEDEFETDDDEDTDDVDEYDDDSEDEQDDHDEPEDEDEGTDEFEFSD